MFKKKLGSRALVHWMVVESLATHTLRLWPNNDNGDGSLCHELHLLVWRHRDSRYFHGQSCPSKFPTSHSETLDDERLMQPRLFAALDHRETARPSRRRDAVHQSRQWWDQLRRLSVGDVRWKSPEAFVHSRSLDKSRVD